MKIILLVAIFFLSAFAVNRYNGYKKGNIIIDLDDRYVDYNEYAQAVQRELIKQGREVSYHGGRKFIIDGSPYLFIERNISIAGIPMQRAILKPEK